MISLAAHNHAMHELRALLGYEHHSEWGAMPLSRKELVELIQVPDYVRELWRRYVEQHPEEGRRLQFILEYRQHMLAHLDRLLQEERG